MNCKREVAPFKGSRYPQPLDRWIGRYEQEVTRTSKRRRAGWELGRILWKFFGRFPSRKGPEMFWATDVEDYKLIRWESGTGWLVVRKELCHVKAFFNYCISEGVPMTNPVITMPYRPTEEQRATLEKAWARGGKRKAMEAKYAYLLGNRFAAAENLVVRDGISV